MVSVYDICFDIAYIYRNNSIVFKKVDVTNGDEVRALFAFAMETLGGLDVVINNAGIDHKPAPMHELSDDDLLEAQIMVKNGINLTHSIIENGFVPLETECVMGSIELGYFGQCDNLWLGYYRDRLVILT